MKTRLILLFALCLAGCSTQTFYVNNERGINPDVDKSQAFFIGGIGQQDEIDAAKTCGGADKVAKVETELTFLDGLLRGITFGFYSPRTARVYCSREPQIKS